jgi:hypothetical protein
MFKPVPLSISYAAPGQCQSVGGISGLRLRALCFLVATGAAPLRLSFCFRGLCAQCNVVRHLGVRLLSVGPNMRFNPDGFAAG